MAKLYATGLSRVKYFIKLREAKISCIDGNIPCLIHHINIILNLDLFTEAAAFGLSQFGIGLPETYIFRTHCYGNESTITHCAGTSGSHYCSYERRAAVMCKGDIITGIHY